MANKLTRRELREYVAPIIRECLQDPSLAAIIEPHLRSGDPTNYAERILNASHSGNPGAPRRSRELAPGVRTFARLGLACALGGGDRAATTEAARALDVQDELAKAMSAGDAGVGGILLRDPIADDVIDVLRGLSIVRRAGPREIEIPAGALKTPRVDTGVSSSYVGEGQAIPAVDLKTGSVQLLARKLATLVVLSNELSQFGTGADIDALVADDMMASISETEDRAFLQGSGAVHEPLGIINAVDAGQKFNANATVNVANVISDLRKIMNLLLNADVPMRSPAWLCAPRTLTFLRTLLDSNNNFVFRQEIEQNRLFGWPVHASTHVPINLGGGSDESYIVFADMSEVMIGDVRQIALDRSNAASVTIDGSLVSLYETDRSALRIRTWNDLALRHSVGAAVMENVTWG